MCGIPVGKMIRFNLLPMSETAKPVSFSALNSHGIHGNFACQGNEETQSVWRNTMKTLMTADLRELVDHPVGTCVSLYMPMHRTGNETQQDPIRLKNQLHDAEKALIAAGQKPDDAQQLLAQAHTLLDNDLFWRQHCSGLALFAAPGFFKYYRLPATVESLTTVADRFHIKPLLGLVSNDGRFFVLALSLNKIRLLDATQHSVREITLGQAPDSLADSIPASGHERQLQFHSEGSAALGKAGTAYYGTGPGTEDNKDNITRYFRLVNKALHEYMLGKRAPLVLSGVEYLLPLYREVNSHFPLMETGIPGSPDTVSAETLRDKAWGIVEPYFNQGRERAANAYRELGGTMRTTNEVAKAVIAAMQGKVDTLFVPQNIHFWGRVDGATGTVELHTTRQAEDQDLLDFATIQTITKNGAAYVVDAEHIPGGGPVAAVYRF